MSSSENQNNQIAGAIMDVPANSNSVAVLPEQPRQPQNLQGLLRFALEATKAEDAPRPSALGPLDEERKKFLEEALKSLTVDIAKLLQNAILVLSDRDKVTTVKCGDELPEDIRTAFDSLIVYVDDIDIANDFYKLGGFSVFAVCYGCENEEVRTLASNLLAEVCQNNPYCQQRALECGLVGILLHMLQNEESKYALTKTMYALSCCIREYDPACRDMLSQNGCTALIKPLKNKVTTVHAKAAFLITYLCKHYPEAKRQFLSLDIIKHLSEGLSEANIQSSEHLLNALQVFVADQDPDVINRCKDKELDLHKILQKHLQNPDFVDPEFREEKETCEGILKAIFGDNALTLDMETIDTVTIDR